MTNPLVRKLSNFAPLSPAEVAAVVGACASIRFLQPAEDIVREGEETQGVKLLLDGIGCGYKTLPDGRRQIVSFFLPGDLVDMRMLTIKRTDHSIGTLSPCRVAIIARETLLEITLQHPGFARALDWTARADDSVTREWIVNVGRRTALERMAHLFCELFYRLRAVGLTEGGGCLLHMTQVNLGDTLALSAVHVNRTLQELRRRKLVTLAAGKLAIYDLVELERLGLFNPGYLYLDKEASTG